MFYDIPFFMHAIPPGITTVGGVVDGAAKAEVLSLEAQSHDIRTFASLPDLEMYKAAEKLRLEQIEFLKSQGINAAFTMVIQPLASSTMKACDFKGGNPMGISSKNHQWFLIMVDYKDPSTEAQVREACRIIIDKCEEITKKNGTYLPFKYANYSSRDQNPLASYDEENLKKLKKIALEYNPTEVFQKLQNGGWLLSRT